MLFDKYCVNGKYISLGPKRSIQTNISKQSCFHNANSFGRFFLVLSSVTHLTEHFIGVQRELLSLL